MVTQNNSESFNLFTNQEGFEEANEMVHALNARKRGPYNKKSPKIEEYNPYTHINKLYSQLGDLIGIRLFAKDDAVFRYKSIKIWSNVYTNEEYEYNDEVFIGEQFQVNQAEVRGTENFTVYDRIDLHKKLINYLINRMDLKDALKLIEQDVKELQKKYKISQYAQWLKKQREK